MQTTPVRLTRAQVREVDRRAIERYHVPGIVLMENAARALAAAAQGMLGAAGDPVVIICGGGNNGGDGLAVARHLHNVGYQVELLLATDPAKYRADALINWNIAQAMRLPWRPAEPAHIRRCPLIIDAIFGTGLDREPRAPFGDLADAINRSGSPVLAVDLPSGLDADTGRPFGKCVRATKTVTFVAEKIGFAQPGSEDYTGEILVGDIGCPREIIAEVMGL